MQTKWLASELLQQFFLMPWTRNSAIVESEILEYKLVFARTRTPLSEILLWMTPSEPPRALQASECSELLDPTRASCLIPAQRQPGKFECQ